MTSATRSGASPPLASELTHRRRHVCRTTVRSIAPCRRPCEACQFQQQEKRMTDQSVDARARGKPELGYQWEGRRRGDHSAADGNGVADRRDLAAPKGCSSCWEVHLRSAALGKKADPCRRPFCKKQLGSALQFASDLAAGSARLSRQRSLGPWIGFGFDEVFLLWSSTNKSVASGNSYASAQELFVRYSTPPCRKLELSSIIAVLPVVNRRVTWRTVSGQQIRDPLKR